MCHVLASRIVFTILRGQSICKTSDTQEQWVNWCENSELIITSCLHAHNYLGRMDCSNNIHHMYCLIQLYVPVSTLLAPRKPLLKLFAIKAVGMLGASNACSAWQAFRFSSHFGNQHFSLCSVCSTADDINIGCSFSGLHEHCHAVYY